MGFDWDFRLASFGMADDFNGVFSDDDLEEEGDSPATSGGMTLGLNHLLIQKNPAVTRLQNSARDTRSRSRSPPTATHIINGNGYRNGTPPPPSTNPQLPNNNGNSHQNPMNGNSSFTPNRNGNGNGNGPSRLNSLVPSNPNPDWSPGTTHRRPQPFNIGSGMSQFLLPGSMAFILVLLYALLSLNANVDDFRSDLRETMNNYQMHLINLQNLHRLEAKEGKEREKRLIARTGKLEGLLQDVLRALRPNLLTGLSPTSPDSFLPSQKERKDGLVSLLEEIQSESPRQSRETFVQLLSTIGETLNDQESRPAGIILLVPPKIQSKGFPACFARKLANGINRIFTGASLEVHPQELSLRQVLDTPELGTIHAELKAYFTYEGGKAVFVQNLEEIQSYEMLMLLHAFCDNAMVNPITIHHASCMSSLHGESTGLKYIFLFLSRHMTPRPLLSSLSTCPRKFMPSTIGLIRMGIGSLRKH